ncbi:hypothetical protein ACFYZH_22945 [Streptomyces abikoensis]|uniref:hypothetical protein n=1 Tax=Streptomyces abikoensis TaxID=97398 RepID=UPI0036CDFAD3
MTTPMNPTPPTTPSPLIRHPSSGLVTTTNFEWMSHEQLRAMIEQADPLGTEDLGAKLQVAAATIKKIGEDLKGHMAKVEWAGQGGDSFREWGTDMANAALRLGEFSHTTGSWMIDAAATLSAVKSAMPEVSTESKTVLDSFRANNPGQVGAIAAPGLSGQSGGLPGAATSGPSQAQAYAAQQQLDADRAEAARLMRKLAESYSWSAHQISTGERPTFRPMPPAVVLVGDPRIGSEYIPMPGSGQRSYDSQSGGGGQAASSAGGQALQKGGYGAALPRGNGHGATDVTSPVGHHDVVLPDRTTGTVVDSATSLPTARTTLPVGPAGDHAGGHPAGGVPSLPGVALPHAPTPMGPVGGGGTSPPMRSAVPSGQGVGQGGGVARPGLAVPRVPEPGIVGGRPVSPGRDLATGQVSRGTVIGVEGQGGAAQGRMPMAAGPVMGGSPGSGNRAGMATGRRLATEPGGVVGGRPVQRPGTAGEFTPGGAGLLRSRPEADGSGSTRGGTQGHALVGPSTGGSTSSRRRGGKRPDYLVEDEETWSQGHRRVVPPVID